MDDNSPQKRRVRRDSLGLTHHVPRFVVRRPSPVVRYHKELRFLWVGGISLVVGCVAYLTLFQSSSLWSRAIPLPGGEDGIFGAIRSLFPAEWLQASRGSKLGLLNVGIYLLILALLFATYWLTLRRASLLSVYLQKQVNSPLSPIGSSPITQHPLRIILLVTALALFILLWLPGTQSADLHSYIWYGRILATFGDNPFVHIPLEYASRDAGDWLSQVAWKDVPSVYGPVWVLMAGGVAWLSNLVSSSDMWPHLLGHKLLASGAHLLNVALMWQVSGLVAQRTTDDVSEGSKQKAEGRSISAQSAIRNPQSAIRNPQSAIDSNPKSKIQNPKSKQLVATLVYAWCPLALIEFGGNGHNDALMLTGVMSALWLHLTGRWRWAAFAFALAALVKVAALLLLPGYLWLLFCNPSLVRRQKAEGSKQKAAQAIQNSKLKTQNSKLTAVAQALLIMAATWTLFYLPFWAGIETLRPLLGGPASNRFINSLASMLRFQGGEWLHALATANGWEAVSRQSVDAMRYFLEWPLRLLTLSVTVPIAVVATWRGRTFPRMVEGWGWMLFVYLTVGAVWFWPWYVTWLLPIAGLAYHGRLSKAIQLLCATSLILYAVYPLILPPFEQVPFYRSLIIIAPPLAYIAFSGLYTVVQRRKLRLRPGLSRT